MNHIWILLAQSILTLVGCVCLWIAYTYTELGGNKWLLTAAIFLFSIGILCYFQRGALAFARKDTRRIQVEGDWSVRDKQYRVLFENASDAVFLMYPDRIIDCNERALKMCGCSKAEILGRSPCEFFPLTQPGEMEPKRDWARKLEETSAEPQKFGWIFCRRDGSRIETEVALNRVSSGDELLVLGVARDVSSRNPGDSAAIHCDRRLYSAVQGTPIPTFVIDERHQVLFWNKALAAAAPLFDAEGIRTGSIETVRDILELRQKEESLRESRRQLANIIDFLPDPTLVIDKEGKVVAWNKAIEEMTGVRAAGILGKGDYEHAIPFYGERRRMLVDLVSDPHEETEAQYVRIDRKDTVLCGEACMPALRGGEVYLVGTASVLRDSRGNITGAIESIRDVTDRRRMEEALELAERNFRGIFENAIMGIFQVSPEGRLISANPACARILGYESPDELIESIRDVREIFREPESYAELVGLLRQSQAVQEFEVQVSRKDDSTAWVSLNALIIRDNKGRVAGIEGNAEDITNRKTLESILVQSQKLEAIGTLARGIAHDFNNILFPIIGFAEMSIQMVPEGSNLRHFLKQILLSANRAKGLVRQILTFSRKTDHELKPVQVSLLVKETIKLIRASFPSTIEIQQRIDPDIYTVTVMSDPSQIHQVLLNLYTNAAHAMREKGGVLRIALTGVYVGSNDRGWEMDLKEGPYIQLTVSDTGHGMDESVKQRIFDPYFTTKGPEGTGLGLAVVYGIVKSLRGAISVLSEPNQGATFHVLLPMCADPELLPAEIDAPLPGGRGTILVVDDEKVLVGMLKMMLTRLGYEVTARVGSADALEAFKTMPKNYDLVITDQTMPQMTGMELAGKILKIRRDIPIILCSGFAEKIDESAAKSAGIKEFIAKPVAFRELAETIRRVLSPTSDAN